MFSKKKYFFENFDFCILDIFDDVRYFLQKNFFSENDSSETCKTIKETKSRNLVSAAQSMWKRQTIFGRSGHNGPPGPNRVNTVDL